MATQTQTMHYLLVGNPGVGKSTLLNGMIGEARFRAGFNPGKGLTAELQKEEHGGNIYMDTPGLADVELRKAAAKAISEALKMDGFYRLFFVVTEEGGRVRPQDKATMQLVLDAAPEIGSQYGVIFNKVSKAGLRKIREDPSVEATIKATLFKDIEPTVFVHYRTLKNELMDEDDVVLPLEDDLESFIKGMPPIRITPSKVGDIKEDKYDALVEQLEKQLKQLKDDNAELRKEMERQREAHEKQLQRQAELFKEANEQLRKGMEGQMDLLRKQLDNQAKLLQKANDDRKRADDDAKRAKQRAQELADDPEHALRAFVGFLGPGVKRGMDGNDHYILDQFARYEATADPRPRVSFNIFYHHDCARVEVAHVASAEVEGWKLYLGVRGKMNGWMKTEKRGFYNWGTRGNHERPHGDCFAWSA